MIISWRLIVVIGLVHNVVRKPATRELNSAELLMIESKGTEESLVDDSLKIDFKDLTNLKNENKFYR